MNTCVHLRNFNKQDLILANFYINNTSFIDNQSAKLQLNLSMETIVTAAFVKLLQNVKCPVLGNRLFNPVSVHGLLGKFCDKLFSTIPFLLFQQFK